MLYNGPVNNQMPSYPQYMPAQYDYQSQMMLPTQNRQKPSVADLFKDVAKDQAQKKFFDYVSGGNESFPATSYFEGLQSGNAGNIYPSADPDTYAGMLEGGKDLATDVSPWLQYGAGGLATALGGYKTYDAFQHGGKGMRTGMSTLGAGIGTMLAPGIGTVVGALAGNALGYGAKKMGLVHKTTKQTEQERWGKLSPAAQGLYAANHPENDSGVWQTGKYAGQKWTFDKALDLAREDPTHFVGVLGNVETFGNDWLKYTPEQQKAIVSGLVNNGLYKADKGDVRIRDKNLALAIRDQVLGQGGASAASISQPASQPQTAAATQPASAPIGVVGNTFWPGNGGQPQFIPPFPQLQQNASNEASIWGNANNQVGNWNVINQGVGGFWQ